MALEQHCHRCNERINSTRICPACGTPAATVVNLRPATLRFQTRNPSVIIAGPDQTTGDYLFKVRDRRVNSQARLATDSHVSLKVEGADNVGRSGERRAIKTLKERLQTDGMTASIEPGDDARGEDSLLICGDQRYTIQVITALCEPDFWRNASEGEAEIDASIDHAVGWIRAAIERKGKKYGVQQLSETILIIDARHAGVIANSVILDAYVSRFADPVSEFGFASVWVIGPAAQYCGRIGGGRP